MASRRISERTDHLGYWLRQVSNHVSTSFARRLDSRGVTVAEWVMLRDLYDVEVLAPSRLAEAMGMTKGAISKLAERLLAKALIVREADAGDGRAHMLSLSAKGRRLVPELAALADENDQEFFASLSAKERTEMRRMLEKVAQARQLRDIPVS
jgi:DNA-binding MarR family transcriptional regulator